jgi:hypothetical protein
MVLRTWTAVHRGGRCKKALMLKTFANSNGRMRA